MFYLSQQQIDLIQRLLIFVLLRAAEIAANVIWTCALTLEPMHQTASQASTQRSWKPLLSGQHDGKALEALPMLFTFTPLKQEHQAHGVVGGFQQAGMIFIRATPHSCLVEDVH